ncbi:MAG TPA: potassium transporter TrkG [bacterium]|nr:potassium transporter TrkG [bacterium]
MPSVHLRFFKRGRLFLSRLLNRILFFSGRVDPAHAVFFGYLSYVIIGWLLLSLPAARIVEHIAPIDNLFVATSAMSTTGLSTISIADNYSLFGQLVILALIQLGGIGYMTFGSFIILSRRPDLPPARAEVSRAVFSLPKSFDIFRFIRSVILFTAVIETVGMLLLWWAFSAAGAPNPLYNAFFHSISSFCTAGFSPFNDSFMSFAGNVWLNGIVSALSYLGAIGFIVFVDYWRRFRGKSAQVTLTSKIILWTTLWMTLIGTALLFLDEPTIRGSAPDKRLLAAFFQCMAAMTTVGFNSVDIGALSKGSILVLTVLMIIGASPSGTGGGVKSTSFSAILGVIRSALRGEQHASFWGRGIPLERVWMAVANTALYLMFLTIGVYLLSLTETATIDKLFFEAASAIGTVGLSMGITGTLTDLGKFIVTLLMLGGRIGPLTVGMVLFIRKSAADEPHDSDLAV